MRTNNYDLSKDRRMNNAIFGLIGEYGEVVDIMKKHLHHLHELNAESLKKEIGDVEWYIAQMCDTLQLTISDDFEPAEIDWEDPWVFVEPSVCIGDLAGVVNYFHAVEVRSEALLHVAEENIILLHKFLVSLAHSLDWTIQEIWELNIEKLNKRYKNGWNPQDSINRVA